MNRHWIQWTSVIALAAAVAVLGAGVASAQEQQPPDPAQPGRPERAWVGERLNPIRHLAGHVIAATGLTPEQVLEQVRAGATLAEIAEANGADADAIIEWEVSEHEVRLNRAVATGRLTREEADAQLAEIRARVVAVMNGEVPFEARRPVGALAQNLLDAAATATGLTPQTVIAQAMAGATLAEVITTNGGDVEAVTAQAIATATEQINAALAEGKLTQEQADRMLANLPDAVARMLEFRPGERPSALWDAPTGDDE